MTKLAELAKNKRLVLVLEYLELRCPPAYRKLLSQLLAADGDDSGDDDAPANDWASPAWRNEVKKRAFKSASITLEQFLAAELQAAQPAPAGKPRAASAASSASASPALRPAKPAAVVPEPPTRKRSREAAAPAPKAVVGSDDDEGFVVKGKPAAAPAQQQQQEQRAERQARGKPMPATENRFCRIDPSKVVFANDRLRDNTAGIEATSFLQNQKMLAVRGKEFNKHKQKNKAKLYAAGVDQNARSFKFEED